MLAMPVPRWARLSIERYVTDPSNHGASPVLVRLRGRVDIERQLVEIVAGAGDDAERRLLDLVNRREYVPIVDPLDEIYLPAARGKRWLVQGIALTGYIPSSWPLLCDPARALDTLRVLASSCVEDGREPVGGLVTARYRLLGAPSRLDEATVWIGDDGLARRLIVRQQHVEVRITFEAFDVPAAVELPPPEDVIDAEDAIARDAFGTAWTTDGLSP